jgi:hypothetical protein
MKKEETIWIKDINVLFKKENLFKYLPLNSYTNYEKINSIMRLTLYFSALLSFLYKNLNYFFIFIICGIVTYLMYINEDKKETKKFEKQIENYKNIETDKDIKKNKINHKKYLRNCVLPTRENPFMNVLPTDNRKRKPACKSYNNEKIKNLVEDKFSKGLFKDINSVYNNENSQREFYTTPNTTVPNKQADFANWLYGVPKTCKEGNGNQCVGNNMERLNGESYKFV